MVHAARKHGNLHSCVRGVSTAAYQLANFHRKLTTIESVKLAGSHWHLLAIGMTLA